MEQGGSSSGCGYKEWGNMRCFENLIVASGFVNILYYIVE